MEEKIEKILLDMEWCHAVKTESLNTAKQQLLALIKEARIDEIQQACRDNWQKPVPEQYMLDRLKTLKEQSDE